MALLSCEGVTVRFGGLVAVDDVSFTVQPGEMVCVIGPNGAGKSTLFNAITGIYRPSGGNIVFRERRLNHAAPHQVVALGIARTFQSSRLFGDMSVLDNVIVGMHTRTSTGVLTALLRHGRSRRELAGCIERAEEILASISASLFDQRHRAAGELAQADRRRLEIARAVASEPHLLLLDEPSSGMDDTETAELAGELTRLLQRFPDRAMMIVEHDMNLVSAFPGRVMVLDYGRKIAEGTFDEIRQLNHVQEAYLGTRAADA